MPRTPDDQKVALACLGIAVDVLKHFNGNVSKKGSEESVTITDIAESFFSFVTGEKEHSARQQLDAVKQALNTLG